MTHILNHMEILMLAYEIEPFADHHIAELTKILDTLHPEKTDHPVIPMTDEEIYIAARDARQALVRFKVCMADEVRQKQQLQEKDRHCRMNHK